MAQKKTPVVVTKPKKTKSKLTYRLDKEDICFLTWHKKWRKDNPINYNHGRYSGLPDSNYRPNLVKLHTPV